MAPWRRKPGIAVVVIVFVFAATAARSPSGHGMPSCDVGADTGSCTLTERALLQREARMARWSVPTVSVPRISNVNEDAPEHGNMFLNSSGVLTIGGTTALSMRSMRMKPHYRQRHRRAGAGRRRHRGARAGRRGRKRHKRNKFSALSSGEKFKPGHQSKRHKRNKFSDLSSRDKFKPEHQSKTKSRSKRRSKSERFLRSAIVKDSKYDGSKSHSSKFSAKSDERSMRAAIVKDAKSDGSKSDSSKFSAKSDEGSMRAAIVKDAKFDESKSDSSKFSAKSGESNSNSESKATGKHVVAKSNLDSQSLESKKHKRKRRKRHKTGFQSCIFNVLILMAVPAGGLLFAFSALLVAKARTDTSMGGVADGDAPPEPEKFDPAAEAAPPGVMGVRRQLEQLQSTDATSSISKLAIGSATRL